MSDLTNILLKMTIPSLHIAILAYDGCVASSVSGFMDVLAVANHTSQQALFAPVTVSRGAAPVRPFSGPLLQVESSIDHPPSCGWSVIYIPPAFGMTAPPEDLVAWVADMHECGSVACAACAGVFFLAAAGILDQRPATTHWGLVETFRKQYPAVLLEPEHMLLDGGDYACAGGLTAYFDLALHLVARFASRETAATCARTLLLDPGRVWQTPYKDLLGAPNTQRHGDPVVDQALQWLEEHHTRPLRFGELAAAVHLGERTLLRRFKKALGRTPSRYLQDVRVEHAKQLLASSTLSIGQVANTIGYDDTPAFHRIFKSLTGLAPGEYRSRFGIPVNESAS